VAKKNFSVEVIMMILWVLVLGRLVSRCQHFGEKCFPHLQGDVKWGYLYKVGRREGRGSGPIRVEE
jgi:hypothetical protein